MLVTTMAPASDRLLRLRIIKFANIYIIDSPCVIPESALYLIKFLPFFVLFLKITLCLVGDSPIRRVVVAAIPFITLNPCGEPHLL